jgi:hypothetical protein
LPSSNQVTTHEATPAQEQPSLDSVVVPPQATCTTASEPWTWTSDWWACD